MSHFYPGEDPEHVLANIAARAAEQRQDDSISSRIHPGNVDGLRSAFTPAEPRATEPTHTTQAEELEAAERRASRASPC